MCIRDSYPTDFYLWHNLGLGTALKDGKAGMSSYKTVSYTHLDVYKRQTNTNGEVPPFKDEIPRSIICVLPVGAPEGKEIFSPATLPCISWPASVTAPFTKLSDFTLEIAPVSYTHLDVYKRQRL